MAGRRWIGLALVALLVIVIISTVGGSAQQNAWMQGYMAGRLSAGGDSGAALAPYVMPGSPFMPRYGGFGHSFGLFIGLGFLALGFFALTRGRDHHARWHARKEEWARRMQEEARQWHERGDAPQQAQPEERPQAEEPPQA
jgi:hypothetical protein